MPKILVVDDAKFLGEGLKRMLRSRGFEAVSTHDGRRALHLVRNDEFDAVITDLMMPDLPGEDLVTQLKENFPQLPCIVMTGHATRDCVLRLAREPNVAGILVKPLNYDRLFATLAKILDRRPEDAPIVTTVAES
jgi:DNA-binding NtrC family response regulator